MYDILIRGGAVIDGTGRPSHRADVAIEGGRIAAVERRIHGSAREEIDASGKLVTPGFIDIHTHYDGQVTWDDVLLPSAAHGVTTAIIGNCGIGFAPVRRGTEDWLITLMEGVEDIPGSVLHDGIDWSWESFPEYLDHIASRRYAFDIAAHVPHSAVRAYVMGARAAADDEATADDLRQIAAIVHNAIAAGAVGVGTSRIAMHQGSDGSPLPGNCAAEAELLAMGRAMRDAGGGVFQMVPSGSGGNIEGGDSNNLAALGKRRDRWSLLEEIAMMRRLTRATGLPITFSFAQSRGLGEATFAAAVEMVTAAIATGESIRPQFSARSTGILSNLDTYHAFTRRPSYVAIADLPLAERVTRMRDPAVKAAILGEKDLPPRSAEPMEQFHLALQKALADTYEITERPDYEPDPSLSITARAARLGRDPLEVLYDLLLGDAGRAVMIALASNYVEGHLGLTENIIRDDRFVLGLGDAGAHVRAICDASIPTFLLIHWGRDRSRGSLIPMELLIRRLTSDPAKLYGFTDRGVIAPGMRADLNIIDFDRLSLGRPYLVADLPSKGTRFLQDARGYDATLVAGVVTRRAGTDTGARPGCLVRAQRTIQKPRVVASPSQAVS